jgi:hypothetical protein
VPAQLVAAGATDKEYYEQDGADHYFRRSVPATPTRATVSPTHACCRGYGRASRRETSRRWRATLGAAVVVVVALVALGACSARRPLPAADTGAIRVGTSGDYPPFSLRAADGGWSGFDVEVARAYATARGRRLELVPFRWPELGTRLAAGDFDVAMSGVTVRPIACSSAP